jgi:hypothetical protein
MKKLFTLSVLLFSLCSFQEISAQEEIAKQIIRGTILDNSSQMPIKDASIEVLNVSPAVIDYSQDNGDYRLEEVPVGRQRLLIKAEGYEDLVISGLNITASKEAVLMIKLDETLVVKEDVVEQPSKKKNRLITRNDKMRAINPMSLTGTRSFTIDEVRRYAGGINDPARLVSTFASIYNTDDQQNYIINRGNAPFGIRTFIEGVPIDNPNHFPTLGNTGSPLSMINPNTMANSEFIRSSFAAEYATAFSGVFDISFRNGNNQKHEFTATVGLFGLEASAEGPFKKGKSSYLFNYRFSLFSLIQLLNFDIGTNALPQYQDLNFKLNFPSQKLGDISIFGMGGYGTSEFLDEFNDPEDPFAEQDINFYLSSGSGVLGVNHQKTLNKRSYIRTTLSTYVNIYNSYRDSILNDSIIKPYYDVNETQIIPGISSYINTKINRNVQIRYGLKSYFYLIDINDFEIETGRNDYLFDGMIFDGQGFFESKIKFSRAWTMSLGLMAQYMNLNENTYAIEPRFSLAFQPSLPHRFTFGYGWHSKFVPFVVSFLVKQNPDGSYNSNNRDLGFIRSHHLELGYQWQFAREWRFKTELFGQYLTDIPIEQTPSSYSLINYGTFSLYPEIYDLVNAGFSYNYGVDATVEKFFSQGFYGHVAGTYFRSMYQGSDGIWRNTGNDVRYIVQFVGGKEFKIGAKKVNVITLDFRLHHHGGRPYTPIDLDESIAQGQEVREEQNAFSVRAKPYTRFDLKVGARFNGRRVSHYIYIDMLNFSGLIGGLAGVDAQNDLQFTFDTNTNTIQRSTQFGFFPLFFYQLQF